jgi:hypothetical protein
MQTMIPRTTQNKLKSTQNINNEKKTKKIKNEKYIL